jgi:hypothetical protein
MGGAFLHGQDRAAYASGARAQPAVDAAVEIRLRAKRRLGDELEAAQERGELAGRGDQDRVRDNVHDGDIIPATLSELGLTRKEAAEAKHVAKPTAEQFDAVLESVKETSSLSEGVTRCSRGGRRSWVACSRPDHGTGEGCEPAREGPAGVLLRPDHGKPTAAMPAMGVFIAGTFRPRWGRAWPFIAGQYAKTVPRTCPQALGWYTLDRLLDDLRL